MEIEYNQMVLVRGSDREGNLVETPGCVICSTPIEIQNDEQMKFFGHPIGTVLYTVELADGSGKLVPESNLRRLP